MCYLSQRRISPIITRSRYRKIKTTIPQSNQLQLLPNYRNFDRKMKISNRSKLILQQEAQSSRSLMLTNHGLQQKITVKRRVIELIICNRNSNRSGATLLQNRQHHCGKDRSISPTTQRRISPTITRSRSGTHTN